MLKPVEPDMGEPEEAVSADYYSPERHPSSATLEIEAGSGLYTTPGTRKLDHLTTPAGCIQMISDPEHLPTITFIKQLCMEHDRFVAFVPRHLKSVLQERLIEGAWRQEENQLIEEQRSFLRALLAKIGVMHPNLEPFEMPDDWDLTKKLTGGDENCEPFFASVWSLVNAGALEIVGKTNQGVILEPTERLFNFSGSLEEDQADSETFDLDQAIA